MGRFTSETGSASWSDLGGLRETVEQAVEGMNPISMQSSAGEPFEHPGQAGDDVRELVSYLNGCRPCAKLGSLLPSEPAYPDLGV